MRVIFKFILPFLWGMLVSTLPISIAPMLLLAAAGGFILGAFGDTFEAETTKEEKDGKEDDRRDGPTRL